MRVVAGLAAVTIGACAGDGRLVVRTVSEYSGTTPIAGVSVEVDDQGWRTTDEAGEARFDAPGGTFVLRAHQVMEGDGFQFDDVWVQPGSGDEVVLAVDGSAVPPRHGVVDGAITGRSGAAGARVRVFAVTSSQIREADAAGDAFTIDADWEVDTTGHVTLHAIETDAADPPTQFLGYATAEVDVAADGTLSGVVLALAPITTAAIATAITLPPELAGVTPTAAVGLEPSGLAFGFADVVPRIDGERAWVQVQAVAGFEGPWSMHARAVDPPTGEVAFDLPSPVELTAPDDDATLAATTVFRWQAAASGEHLMGLTCEWTDGAVQRNLNVRRLNTAADEAAMASVPVSPASGASCRWGVTWQDETDDNWRFAYSSRALVVP